MSGDSRGVTGQGEGGRADRRVGRAWEGVGSEWWTDVGSLNRRLTPEGTTLTIGGYSRPCYFTERVFSINH